MSLDLIAITPNLANEVKLQQIKEKVVARLVELKINDVKFKNNQDVLLLICNLVEHLTKDKKIKKKDLVLEILQSMFSLTPAERAIIENNIEFLHSNKAIKKLSRFYLFCVGAYEYLFRYKKKD